ncbi:MAG: hypothetical protein RLZZ230_496 [Candidatus Parcubacteria bacterium]
MPRPCLGKSTFEISMPLPGNHEWLVTTETGGYDCNGSYDQYHDNNNYFSIDFSSGNRADTGATVYNSTSDIPVLAVADGKIIKSEFNSGNGNYVIIDHDEDGNLNTGFSTWYLHFKYLPSVVVGAIVKKGDIIGYMGNTGISYGTHLHFGVRYKNNGASSVPELAKVIMEGHLLKGYQTECSLNSKGEPISPKRYYRSYNLVY